MNKALVAGLGLVLGVGVVYAEPTRASKRKPPATAPASGNSQPAAPTPTPASTPAPAAPATSPPAASPPASPPAATPPTSAGRKPPPMKTDEKAGANESLTKSASGPTTPSYKNVSPADEQRAGLLFHQGNERLNQGVFPEAVSRYREALRYWDHPGIHYNLALALINLDQPTEVFAQLNDAIKYGADPIGQDKFDHAKEYLKLVGGQLADLEVSCDKPGAKVAVDGKEVFVAPGAYRSKVRVGKHTFYGEKEGYNARVTAPFIGPGETFRIELKLYTAKELTRYRCKWDCGSHFGYYVLGAGVLVGLGGGALTLASRSDYKSYDDAVARCNTTSMGCSANTPGIADMRTSGDTKRTLSFVGYGVAGAAVATGAILLWLNRSQPYTIRPEDLEENAEPTSTTKRPLAVAPIVSPQIAGAMVQGHF